MILCTTGDLHCPKSYHDKVQVTRAHSMHNLRAGLCRVYPASHGRSKPERALRTTFNWLEIPIKNLSSQLTHCQLTWKLTASSFRGYSSRSQQTPKVIPHGELETKQTHFLKHNFSATMRFTRSEPFRVVIINRLWLPLSSPSNHGANW